MLQTVKQRLLVLTISLLLVFSAVTISLAMSSFYTNKENRQKNVETLVAYVGEKITTMYEEHHKIATELVGMATVYYSSGKTDKKILENSVLEFLGQRVPKAGIGIWYEPKAIKKQSQWFCVFAYNKDGKVESIGDSLENADYNYTDRDFYTYIKKEAEAGVQNIFVPTICGVTGTPIHVLTLGAGIFANSKYVGGVTVDWKLDEIKDKIADYKPTKNSYILFGDRERDFIITLTTADEKIISSSFKTLPWYQPDLKTGDVFDDQGKKFVAFPYTLANGLFLMVNVPFDELYGDLYSHIHSLIALMSFLVLAISGMTYYILSKNVNKPIQYLINMANKIGNGDLHAKLEIDRPEDFVKLAKAINKMTNDIETYMTNLHKVTTEKERMEAELSIGRAIQLSSLPSIFPPYPDCKSFDIYASTEPAKEVGGDFYDFFFIDSNHFAFLIADVSGKGVPAALFMMTTKTTLKNVIKTGKPIDEAITLANHKICKNNQQDYFETLLIGVVELSTGKIEYVNAGHNPLLIKRGNNDYEYQKLPSSLMIGAMDEVSYRKVEDHLKPGDQVFFYTDGITEATNEVGGLYGEDKLLSCLNTTKDLPISEIIPAVKKDIKYFVDGAEQSDDITAVVFRYNGNK